ncbi:MAG: hypothetical protein JNK58_04300 [Phycisphaerae bacterium]|nr:hypothetical protein [Phycisphaerae bacterium]
MTRSPRPGCVRLVIFALLLPAALPATAAPPIPQPTRRDLAAAYLAFESAMHESPPRPEQRAELNQRFDALTADFFSARISDAIRRLAELTLSLTPSALPVDLAARSVRVRIVPQVYCHDPAGPSPSIELSALFDTPGAEAFTAEVVLRSTADAEREARFPVTLDFVEGRVTSCTVPMNPSDFALPPGGYSVSLVPPGRPVIDAGWFVVTPAPITELRASAASVLQSIDAAGPQARELAIVRSRLSTITDRPGEEKSALFLTDPLARLNEVREEILAIADQRRNPYHQRAGTYWRTLELGDGRVMPMWIHAPGTPRMLGPLPVVIALHGAGGDESLFVQGYGKGRIVELADSAPFLLVSPSTLLFGSDPAILDRLLDDLAHDYPIDRTRIYLLGHSLGSIAASGLASARRETVAAAACIAGFRPLPPNSRTCPILILAGEIDPIFTPVALRAAVESTGAQAPIDLRIIANEGHTLIVGECLPQAIEWLLGHRRLERTNP